MRIVSLLPSATEIVCALGARDSLVGRSHECDHPAGVQSVPVLTRARLAAGLSSKAIDATARTVLADATSIYEIDVEGLERAKPDVIVTQDLCDLCAVSIDDVRAAVARLARRDVRLVNVGPMVLEHVWSDIQRTGDAIGRRELAAAIVARLKERIAEIDARARRRRTRPKVVTIEWLDPLMLGGLWMPELVALAGGTPVGTRAGAHGPTLDRRALEELDPDVVLVAPCGFTVERTLAEVDVLRAQLPAAWRAVRDRRVYVADGNAFFNRPGPRMVESLEILAAAVHPDAFADVAERHPRALLRL